MVKEIWKDVVGYEGIYQVSNLGNIKSLNYNGTRKEKKLALSINGDGYRFALLYKDKKYSSISVHRIVAKNFISNPNNKPQVNHIDGNKLNNNINNLEWVTQSENAKHAYKLGLMIRHRGELNGTAKLKEKDIKDIFKLSKFLSHKELSIMFDVSRRHINRILNKNSWKHVEV